MDIGTVPEEIVGDSRLVFPFSNENLEGIVHSLDLDKTDSVLAICGSGDQAFAFAPHVAKVTALDILPSQVAYAKRRLELVKNGRNDLANNYKWLTKKLGLTFATKNFLIGSTDWRYCLESRNEFFNQNPQTPQSAQKISFHQGDFFTHLDEHAHKYSVIYASNATHMFFGRHEDSSLDFHRRFESLRSKLNPNARIYISDFLIHEFHAVQQNLSALPVGYRIDRYLTEIAREKTNSLWVPVVIRPE